jgi:hypothetical protein
MPLFSMVVVTPVSVGKWRENWIEGGRFLQVYSAVENGCAMGAGISAVEMGCRSCTGFSSRKLV